MEKWQWLQTKEKTNYPWCRVFINNTPLGRKYRTYMSLILTMGLAHGLLDSICPIFLTKSYIGKSNSIVLLVKVGGVSKIGEWGSKWRSKPVTIDTSSMYLDTRDCGCRGAGRVMKQKIVFRRWFFSRRDTGSEHEKSRNVSLSIQCLWIKALANRTLNTGEREDPYWALRAPADKLPLVVGERRRTHTCPTNKASYAFS